MASCRFSTRSKGIQKTVRGANVLIRSCNIRHNTSQQLTMEHAWHVTAIKMRALEWHESAVDAHAVVSSGVLARVQDRLLLRDLTLSIPEHRRQDIIVPRMGSAQAEETLGHRQTCLSMQNASLRKVMHPDMLIVPLHEADHTSSRPCEPRLNGVKAIPDLINSNTPRVVHHKDAIQQVAALQRELRRHATGRCSVSTTKVSSSTYMHCVCRRTSTQWRHSLCDGLSAIEHLFHAQGAPARPCCGCAACFSTSSPSAGATARGAPRRCPHQSAPRCQRGRCQAARRTHRLTGSFRKRKPDGQA